MKWFMLGAAVFGLTACVSLPDVYLIDRHTVMESEASGEWPELERRFTDNTPNKGPENLGKEPFNQRRKQAFNVLNGEFPSEYKDASKQPK